MIEYIILLLMAIFLIIFVFVLLKREQERQEQERKIQEACERIDSLGGTTYIKQQLKTKSAGKIAEKHNLTLESLNRYCQEQGTSINQLKKEIQKEERLRKKQEKQRQQQEQKRKIQEVYEALNRLGGAEHIKQQLKTKNAEEIAQEYNINTKNLNQYCQEQGTSINQLKKEIQKEERLRKKQEKQRQQQEQKRKIQEVYEALNRLGGAEHIKQQLKTKNAEEIAQEYNINTKNLNQYCQKQGTSIKQLKKEIQNEEIQHQKRLEKQRQNQKRLEKQRQERQRREEERQQQEQERQRREKERKIQEAYERIDRLGGIKHIKQLLHTTKPEIIAQRYNITPENLNQYCQKQGTHIKQLKKENQVQQTQRQLRQQQEQERQRQQINRYITCPKCFRKWKESTYIKHNGCPHCQFEKLKSQRSRYKEDHQYFRDLYG